jgi:hypothetical protein
MQSTGAETRLRVIAAAAALAVGATLQAHRMHPTQALQVELQQLLEDLEAAVSTATGPAATQAEEDTLAAALCKVELLVSCDQSLDGTTMLSDLPCSPAVARTLVTDCQVSAAWLQNSTHRPRTHVAVCCQLPNTPTTLLPATTLRPALWLLWQVPLHLGKAIAALWRSNSSLTQSPAVFAVCAAGQLLHKVAPPLYAAKEQQQQQQQQQQGQAAAEAAAMAMRVAVAKQLTQSGLIQLLPQMLQRVAGELDALAPHSDAAEHPSTGGVSSSSSSSRGSSSRPNNNNNSYTAEPI